jgi:hypothetical protein
MLVSDEDNRQRGDTLVELILSFVVFAIVVIAVFTLLTALIGSSQVAKEKSIATILATNQMEYLKSLPYDSLAVANGSIYTTNPLPATNTKTVNGLSYIVTTTINYVDDAYNGCAQYPSLALEKLYCRNYPPPSGAPAIGNGDDYKIINVSVKRPGGAVLTSLDTEAASRVAETASSTGALLVTVIDSSGDPITGAAVTVVNNTLSPTLNLAETSDANGVAIFYGLPPDSTADYVVSASESGYSSISTIAASGSLQPTYPNQNIVVQETSSITLTIKEQGSPSLLAQAVDTNGNPISGLKLYLKGGYKKYTSSTNTQYYYDNLSPDTRPATDSSGFTAFSNLAPGSYYFCGDDGSSSCVVGSTTYYLVAAIPYSGNNSFNPTNVPSYDPSNPPATTYSYNGNSYLQEVHLMFSTSANFPRVSTLSPSTISLGSTNLSSFSFQLTGANLCSSSGCSPSINLVEGANNYPASCTGKSTQLTCTDNLTGITQGYLQLSVQANGLSFASPTSPTFGGISVTP